MIRNAKSDERRQLVPPPGRQTKAQGVGTLFKLTESTGLTKPDDSGRQVMKSSTGGGTLPAFARIFNAMPGVENKAFTPAAQKWLVRK